MIHPCEVLLLAVWAFDLNREPPIIRIPKNILMLLVIDDHWPTCTYVYHMVNVLYNYWVDVLWGYQPELVVYVEQKVVVKEKVVVEQKVVTIKQKAVAIEQKVIIEHKVPDRSKNVAYVDRL